MRRRLPALSFREAVRALERLGFQIDHVTGSPHGAERRAQQGSRDSHGDLDRAQRARGIDGKLDPSMVVNREVL